MSNSYDSEYSETRQALEFERDMILEEIEIVNSENYENLLEIERLQAQIRGTEA